MAKLGKLYYMCHGCGKKTYAPSTGCMNDYSTPDMLLQTTPLLQEDAGVHASLKDGQPHSASH